MCFCTLSMVGAAASPHISVQVRPHELVASSLFLKTACGSHFFIYEVILIPVVFYLCKLMYLTYNSQIIKPPLF